MTKPLTVYSLTTLVAHLEIARPRPEFTLYDGREVVGHTEKGSNAQDTEAPGWPCHPKIQQPTEQPHFARGVTRVAVGAAPCSASWLFQLCRNPRGIPAAVKNAIYDSGIALNSIINSIRKSPGNKAMVSKSHRMDAAV